MPRTVFLKNGNRIVRDFFTYREGLTMYYANNNNELKIKSVRDWYAIERMLLLSNNCIAMGGDYFLTIYDPESDKPVKEFSGDDDGINTMLQLSDESLAVSANFSSLSDDRLIRIYNLDDYSLITSFGEGDDIDAMLQLSDNTLAVGSHERSSDIRIYNLQNQRLEKQFSQGGQSVNAMVQLSNGLLVVGGYNGFDTMRVYDLQQQRLKKQFSQNRKGISAMLELPNKMLAVCGYKGGSPTRNQNGDATILIYNTEDWTLVKQYKPSKVQIATPSCLSIFLQQIAAAEIEKIATTLHNLTNSKACIFSTLPRIPPEICIEIAGFSGDHMVLNRQQAEEFVSERYPKLI